MKLLGIRLGTQRRKWISAVRFPLSLYLSLLVHCRAPLRWPKAPYEGFLKPKTHGTLFSTPKRDEYATKAARLTMHLL